MFLSSQHDDLFMWCLKKSTIISPALCIFARFLSLRKVGTEMGRPKRLLSEDVTLGGKRKRVTPSRRAASDSETSRNSKKVAASKKGKSNTANKKANKPSKLPPRTVSVALASDKDTDSVSEHEEEPQRAVSDPEIMQSLVVTTKNGKSGTAKKKNLTKMHAKLPSGTASVSIAADKHTDIISGQEVFFFFYHFVYF